MEYYFKWQGEMKEEDKNYAYRAIAFQVQTQIKFVANSIFLFIDLLWCLLLAEKVVWDISQTTFLL